MFGIGPLGYLMAVIGCILITVALRAWWGHVSSATPGATGKDKKDVIPLEFALLFLVGIFLLVDGIIEVSFYVRSLKA